MSFLSSFSIQAGKPDLTRDFDESDNLMKLELLEAFLEYHFTKLVASVPLSMEALPPSQSPGSVRDITVSRRWSHKSHALDDRSEPLFHQDTSIRDYGDCAS